MPSRQIRPPLSDEEIEKLRELLIREARVTWLWSTARTWAVWIAAVVGGVTIGWDTLTKIVRSLGKG